MLNKIEINFNGKNLNQIFGDPLTSLEIIYLIHDLKPLVRTLCPVEGIKGIENFCKKNNLHISCGYKMVYHKEKKRPFYSDSECECVPLDSEKGMLVLYISKNKSLAKSASNPSLTESREMGIMLGYPKCCVDFYMKNLKKAMSKNADFVLLTPLTKKSYPYQNNICLRPFGISLLSHFPCRFDCKESFKLASKNLRFLNKEIPKIGKFFCKELKSFVVYSEYQGIHYTNNYSTKWDRVKFGFLHSTFDSPLRRELMNSKEILIKSNKHFFIENKEYKSEDFGLLSYY